MPATAYPGTLPLLRQHPTPLAVCLPTLRGCRLHHPTYAPPAVRYSNTPGSAGSPAHLTPHTVAARLHAIPPAPRTHLPYLPYTRLTALLRLTPPTCHVGLRAPKFGVVVLILYRFGQPGRYAPGHAPARHWTLPAAAFLPRWTIYLPVVYGLCLFLFRRTPAACKTLVTPCAASPIIHSAFCGQ